MKQYKTLKDLPGIPAGEMGQPNRLGNGFVNHHFDNFYTYSFMEKHPDFFEEVKEEEKLFTLSDMRNLYIAHTNNPHFTFQGLMLQLFPNIKID